LNYIVPANHIALKYERALRVLHEEHRTDWYVSV